MTEWRWISVFADQLRENRLVSGEVVAILSESGSRPVLVETARLAAQLLGGQVFDVVVVRRSAQPVRAQPGGTQVQRPCRHWAGSQLPSTVPPSGPCAGLAPENRCAGRHGRCAGGP